MYQPHQLRTIHLAENTPLWEMCGRQTEITLAASNMSMVVSGLVSRFGVQVKQYIAENLWNLYFDDVDGEPIEAPNVQELKDTKDIWLLPNAIGAGGKTGAIILGIVLVVVGVVMMFTPAAPGAAKVMGVGIGMIQGAMFVAGGLMMIYTAMTMPSASDARAASDEKPSFIFNNAVNVLEQGGAVPLVYGRFKTGSTVVSAGINTEQLSTYNSPPDNNGSPDEDFNIEEQPLI